MNINKCAPELINDTPRFQLARQGASNRRGGAKRAERAAEKERESETAAPKTAYKTIYKAAASVSIQGFRAGG